MQLSNLSNKRKHVLHLEDPNDNEILLTVETNPDVNTMPINSLTTADLETVQTIQR